MEKVVVGKLLDSELNEIKELFEKKNALENLTKIIDANNELLYTKLINDYGKVISKFNLWWNITYKKYNWQGENWSIDFDTSEVILSD